MCTDLTHNRIVADTMTPAFEASFRASVLPALAERFGTDVCGVVFYEDYLRDDFTAEGRFYYPLTVLLPSGAERVWLSWDISDPALFRGGVPFSFLGDNLTFTFPTAVPSAFADALCHRRLTYDETALPIRVELPDDAACDPLWLVGKISQTFLDTLAADVTAAIEAQTGVCDLAASGAELVFAIRPDTFMEHTSEGVTYRRLLLREGVRTERDLWVRWDRLDGAGAYSAADVPAPGSIRFRIGEDVSVKIREREYRYLLRKNPAQYQKAIGRKAVTDWRDILKRIAQKAEDRKAPPPRTDEELLAELSRLVTADTVAPAAPTVMDDDIAEALRKIVGESAAPAESIEPTAFAEEIYEAPAPTVETDGVTAESIEPTVETEPMEIPAEASDAEAEEAPAEMKKDTAAEPTEFIQETISFEETLSPEAQSRTVREQLEKNRAELERMKEESRRAAADAERLAQLRQQTEEQAARERETALAAEKERLRQREIDLNEREAALRETVLSDMRRVNEEREQARLADEARTALEEERQKAAERAAFAEEKNALCREREAFFAERETEMEDRRAEAEAFAAEKAAFEAEKAELLARVSDAESQTASAKAACESLREELSEARAALEAARLAQARLEEEKEAQARLAEEARLAKEERLAEARRVVEEAEREQRALAEERAEEERRLEEAETARRAEEDKYSRECDRLEQERAEREEAEEAFETYRQKEAEERIADLEDIRQREDVLDSENAQKRAAEQFRKDTLYSMNYAEAEAKRRREEMQKKQEDAARVRTEAGLCDDEDAPEIPYTYTSYLVHLYFNRAVDPNVQPRIRELISRTVSYYKKEHVLIAIRCAIVSGSEVDLYIKKMPREEYDLLLQIIQVLGKSDLGVYRVSLDEEPSEADIQKLD